MLARVDEVTKDDLADLAAELYAPDQLSAACIGPSEERFRAALAPVDEALAAA
jgi:predicted Zn-dependent peptidase